MGIDYTNHTDHLSEVWKFASNIPATLAESIVYTWNLVHTYRVLDGNHSPFITCSTQNITYVCPDVEKET